jgi:hypothetical protein
MWHPPIPAYMLCSKFLRPREDDAAFCKRLTIEGGESVLLLGKYPWEQHQALTHAIHGMVAYLQMHVSPVTFPVTFSSVLPTTTGVTLIPISGFYIGPNPPRHLVSPAVALKPSAAMP